MKMKYDDYKLSSPPEPDYSEEVFSHEEEYYFDTATLYLKISDMNRVLSAKAVYHDEMTGRNVILGAYMLLFYMNEQADQAFKSGNSGEMYEIADDFSGEITDGDYSYDKLVELSRPVHKLEDVAMILGDSINTLNSL